MKMFETTVSMLALLESGIIRKVRETYLVDAETFGDAEAQAVQYAIPHAADGDPVVTAVRHARVQEVYIDKAVEDPRYFAARVEYVVLNEKSGSETRVSNRIIVAAEDMTSAKKIVEKKLNETLCTYSLTKIEETKISEIISEILNPKTNEQ